MLVGADDGSVGDRQLICVTVLACTCTCAACLEVERERCVNFEKLKKVRFLRAIVLKLTDNFFLFVLRALEITLVVD